MASERVREIDGLRGWAAFSVVLFHLLQQMFAVVQGGICPPSVWICMDGPMAVFIFFILSGDALSTAHVTYPARQTLDRIIIRRYFRLTVPILITVLATYGLLKAGWIFNQQAGPIVHRADWIGPVLMFPASLFDATKYSLTILFGGVGMMHVWNPFLWTMPIEMFGSFLVFGYLHILGRLRWPKLCSAGLVVMLSLVSNFYGLFFLGVLFAQLRASGWLVRFRRSVYGWVIGNALLIGAYVFCYLTARYPPDASQADVLSFVETWIRAYQEHILAMMIVSGAYLSSAMIWFLRSAASRLMGRLSFAMYLTQFPVLCSLESFLIIRDQSHVSALSSVLGIAGCSILVTLLSAEIVTRLDNFSLRWIGFWLDFLFISKNTQFVKSATVPVEAV